MLPAGRFTLTVHKSKREKDIQPRPITSRFPARSYCQKRGSKENRQAAHVQGGTRVQMRWVLAVERPPPCVDFLVGLANPTPTEAAPLATLQCRHGAMATAAANGSDRDHGERKRVGGHRHAGRNGQQEPKPNPEEQTNPSRVRQAWILAARSAPSSTSTTTFPASPSLK